VADVTTEEHAAAIASSMLEQLPAFEADLLDRILREIPELRGDETVKELLAASVGANVAMSLDVLAHGLDVSDLAPPPAAAEYARRLAQRGVPVEALLRAYRVGNAGAMEWWLRALDERRADGPQALGVMTIAFDHGFRYVDRISEQLIGVYLGERERWLQSASATRAATVRALLAGDPPDLDAVETTLHYRLDRRHVGVVAWLDGSQPVGEGLARLDRVVSALARASAETPLVVMPDETSLWAWLAVRAESRVGPEALEHAESGGGVRIALGDACDGLDGFRLTHRQALLTRRVAEVAGGDALTTYADSSLLAFLVSDLVVTRSWVGRVLGGLASDDAATARLRETVRVFLETKGSYTKTATRLHLHKNTVHYRIGKAQDLRGRPLDDDRLALEVALIACQHLGATAMPFTRRR
jgi:hypothetical protein